MNKIKSFKNAQELVDKMLNDSDIHIVMWDGVESNRVVSAEPDMEYPQWCWLNAVDSVNGTYEHVHVRVADFAQFVFTVRKNINELNNLEIL